MSWYKEKQITTSTVKILEQETGVAQKPFALEIFKSHLKTSWAGGWTKSPSDEYSNHNYSVICENTYRCSKLILHKDSRH